MASTMTMMKAMVFILPFPPSANAYYRSVVVNGHSRLLISAKGRRYRSNIAETMRRCYVTEPLTGPLTLLVTLAPPNNAKRDIDNYQKALLDSLTKAGLWLDDAQIKRACWEWEPKRALGRATVKVYPYVSKDSA